MSKFTSRKQTNNSHLQMVLYTTKNGSLLNNLLLLVHLHVSKNYTERRSSVPPAELWTIFKLTHQLEPEIVQTLRVHFLQRTNMEQLYLVQGLTALRYASLTMQAEKEYQNTLVQNRIRLGPGYVLGWLR